MAEKTSPERWRRKMQYREESREDEKSGREEERVQDGWVSAE